MSESNIHPNSNFLVNFPFVQTGHMEHGDPFDKYVSDGAAPGITVAGGAASITDGTSVSYTVMIDVDRIVAELAAIYGVDPSNISAEGEGGMITINFEVGA